MAAGLLALLIAGTLVGSAADAAREDRARSDYGYHQGGGYYGYAPYGGYGGYADYGYGGGYAPYGGYDGNYGDAGGYYRQGGGYDGNYGGGGYERYGDDGW